VAKRRTILVVEDEPDLADLLRHNIERAGYACRVAHDGRSALDEASREPPDLCVLDRMLPVMSGDDVIARLKRDPRTASLPVIMLTAKAEESDELVGFALGADDYVTKPFSMTRLLARIAAMFRSLEPNDSQGVQDVLTAGPITLDRGRHELIVDGQPVPATATEFRLLEALMEANGRVLSRARLIDTGIGTDVAVTDRTVDVHITALRKKLGEGAPWIQTVRGVGYTFREPI
jgi:two-component system phosphate regulon response regulator PhoB